MLTDDIFNEILIKPAQAGADSLFIVSAYATPALVAGHFDVLPSNVKIKLIIGMAGKEGILAAHHQAYNRLQREDYPGRFECYYLVNGEPVHSKLYVWTINDWPMYAYLGSANYSYNGMKSNREVMENTDANDAYKYFQNLLNDSISCTDPKVLTCVSLHETTIDSHPDKISDHPTNQSGYIASATTVDICLLDNKGNMPARSGLNWGKRPEYKRNPNQAYIRVPSSVAKSGFFPPRGIFFTIVTDDGKTFDAVVAQANNKAIETPKDNSLLGKYFRERLGLPDGAEVKKYHLESYGRFTITFTKIDDETYFMDFSTTKRL